MSVGTSVLRRQQRLRRSGCRLLISMVGTVTGSTVGGNLGADTIILKDVVKGAAIYGGGGFEYDTSLTVLTASALIPSSAQAL